MELPIQTMEGNRDADQSKENEGIEKRVRREKREERILRSGTEEQEKTKEKVTPGGKEIKIVQAINSPHLKIIFSTGGELPSELQGFFTDRRTANFAIDAYLNKKGM